MTFFKTLKWHSLAQISNSKLMKLTILIPIIGYMVLFNENIVEFLNLSQEIFPNEGLKSSVNEGISRLYYFYFGLTFIGIAMTLYQVFCPTQVKFSMTPRHFVELNIRTLTLSQIRGHLDIIKHFESGKIETGVISQLEKVIQNLTHESNIPDKEKLSILASDILYLQWGVLDVTYNITRGVVTWLLYIGIIILTIPSLLMFLKVINAYFGI